MLYLYAGGLTSFGGTASTSRLYPLTDPLGNVRFITDSAGNLIARYSYDPFGNVTKKEGTVNSVFTFSGEQFDPETSLTFLRARYYDSSTGMFLSRDPVLGPLNAPLEHGEYLYARNNPVNLSDPSGELVQLGARGIAAFRKLGTVNPGVHFYLDIIPDNRQDFSDLGKHRYHFSLSANHEPNIFGKLVKAPLDYEFKYGSDVRGLSEIAPPDGMSDTGFIRQLLNIFNKYDNSRNYRVRANQRFMHNGNSNNFAWSLLAGAGVNLDDIRNCDPWGWAPGWGTAFNEML